MSKPWELSSIQFLSWWVIGDDSRPFWLQNLPFNPRHASNNDYNRICANRKLFAVESTRIRNNLQLGLGYLNWIMFPASPSRRHTHRPPQLGGLRLVQVRIPPNLICLLSAPNPLTPRFTDDDHDFPYCKYIEENWTYLMFQDGSLTAAQIFIGFILPVSHCRALC